MAERIDITIDRDTEFEVGDYIELTVDDVVQSDRISVWPNEFVRANASANATLAHRTLSAFVAGDYAIKLRGRDRAGHDSGYSDAYAVEHRPIPPSPHDLSVGGDQLCWQWSDP